MPGTIVHNVNLLSIMFVLHTFLCATFTHILWQKKKIGADGIVKLVLLKYLWTYSVLFIYLFYFTCSFVAEAVYGKGDFFGLSVFESRQEINHFVFLSAYVHYILAYSKILLVPNFSECKIGYLMMAADQWAHFNPSLGEEKTINWFSQVCMEPSFYKSFNPDFR